LKSHRVPAARASAALPCANAHVRKGLVASLDIGAIVLSAKLGIRI
jgi:hypothetical protein